jgi:kumamolisin
LEGKTSITKEIVWNQSGGGSGGGVSNFFPKPSYQDSVNVPKPVNPQGGRGVPDISGNGAPETGYKVRVDGTDSVVGGTSAVAPLWAALIALIAENIGARVPNLNTLLYSNPGVLNDITEGNNDVSGIGSYLATKGWDPCTGLGSPKGLEILNLLKQNLAVRLASTTNSYSVETVNQDKTLSSR